MDHTAQIAIGIIVTVGAGAICGLAGWILAISKTVAKHDQWIEQREKTTNVLVDEFRREVDSMNDAMGALREKMSGWQARCLSHTEEYGSIKATLEYVKDSIDELKTDNKAIRERLEKLKYYG